MRLLEGCIYNYNTHPTEPDYFVITSRDMGFFINYITGSGQQEVHIVPEPEDVLVSTIFRGEF